MFWISVEIVWRCSSPVGYGGPMPTGSQQLNSTGKQTKVVAATIKGQ